MPRNTDLKIAGTPGWQHAFMTEMQNEHEMANAVNHRRYQAQNRESEKQKLLFDVIELLSFPGGHLAGSTRSKRLSGAGAFGCSALGPPASIADSILQVQQ